MQIGSVARLATLLTGLSQPASVKGRTDGKHTDLTFTPDDSTGFYAFNSVDGEFAGETVHINSTPEIPVGSRDLVMHMKSSGGSVPVELTVREEKALDGCTGVTVNGNVDGKSVNLKWDVLGSALQGDVAGQRLTVASKSEPLPYEPYGSFNVNGTLTGALGKDSVDTSVVAQMHTNPRHFNVIAETGFDVKGRFGNVAVDEHEIPYHGFLTW